EVGIVANDDWRMAAKLHHRRLGIASGTRCDQAADTCRTGKYHLARNGTVDQTACHQFRIAVQEVDHAFGETCSVKGADDIGNSRWRLAGRAQDDRASDCKRRGQLARGKGSREVPW